MPHVGRFSISDRKTKDNPSPSHGVGDRLGKFVPSKEAKNRGTAKYGKEDDDG